MDDHEQVRVFDEVLKGDDAPLGEVEVETVDGTLEFTMTDVPRAVRLDYQGASLKGIDASAIDMEDGDLEEMSEEELMQEVLSGGADLGDITPGAERAEKAEELVAESLEHDRYSQSEIEMIVGEFGDDVLFGLAEEIITESRDVSGVTDFRVK
jgi:hypothetical protein